MNKFDFSYDNYQYFLERCPFSDDELAIIEMRRKGKSIVEMRMELSISESTVSRRIESITKKILKEI
jgi:DNA-binding NarL/FixJ family response regulator